MSNETMLEVHTVCSALREPDGVVRTTLFWKCIIGFEDVTLETADGGLAKAYVLLDSGNKLGVTETYDELREVARENVPVVMGFGGKSV